MTAMLDHERLDFVLDDEHEAHEPPEARGLRRDGVRLLVSPERAEPVDAHFSDLGTFLVAGDLVVVNTSATIPGALDGRLPDGEPVVVHVSGTLPGDVSLVEVRRPHDGSTVPMQLVVAGAGSSCSVAGTPICSRRSQTRNACGCARLEITGAWRHRLPERTRTPDPVPPCPSRVAARELPDDLREGARQRRDAEREPAVHPRSGHRPGRRVAF